MTAKQSLQHNTSREHELQPPAEATHPHPHPHPHTHTHARTHACVRTYTHTHTHTPPRLVPGTTVSSTYCSRGTATNATLEEKSENERSVLPLWLAGCSPQGLSDGGLLVALLGHKEMQKEAVDRLQEGRGEGRGGGR